VLFVQLPCQHNEIHTFCSSGIVLQSQLRFSTTTPSVRIMGTPTPPMVDSNIGGLLLALLWSLASVSACILVLRLYTGAFILRIKLPDYLMIIAFVSATSILQPRYAEANFLYRFVLSCKLHSSPLRFTGVWADIQPFSVARR
jgi:asparagine N-glycosylation enzyme membrane subunit Stt3